MPTAREPAPGSRCAGLSAGRGWQAVGKDGEPGLRAGVVRRGRAVPAAGPAPREAPSGQAEGAVPGGVRGGSAGLRTAISRHHRVAIMALPPRTPCPARMSWPAVTAVSWCSQAAMLAASSAPHIQARLTWGYPEGRCRRAAPSLLSRKMFSTVVRCRYFPLESGGCWGHPGGGGSGCWSVFGTAAKGSLRSGKDRGPVAGRSRRVPVTAHARSADSYRPKL